MRACNFRPREFVECIGHVRLLSWLLLGSLTHTALYGSSTGHTSQPIPQEASCQIADHIQVIMAAFAEQPKASVLHMSSLFHTFILCQVNLFFFFLKKIKKKKVIISANFQLWTVYLEQGLVAHIQVAETYNITMNILFDFWSKVTPCILQLVQQSKMVRFKIELAFILHSFVFS